MSICPYFNILYRNGVYHFWGKWKIYSMMLPEMGVNDLNDDLIDVQIKYILFPCQQQCGNVPIYN